MNKLRGFRLGRRLVRVWRWVRRRRRLKRRAAYLRLTPTASPSRSRPPHLHSQYHHKETTAVTAKIAQWGRSLTRRFRPSSHVCFRRGGQPGREEDDHLLPASLREMGEMGLPRQPRKQRRLEEEEEEAAAWSKPPPKGHLAVYVGREGVEPPHRVLVPVVYFNHPLFGELLREAEDEFGFHHPGGITIPCPISHFERVRTRVAAAASGLGCRHSSRATGLRR